QSRRSAFRGETCSPRSPFFGHSPDGKSSSRRLSCSIWSATKRQRQPDPLAVAFPRISMQLRSGVGTEEITLSGTSATCAAEQTVGWNRESLSLPSSKGTQQDLSA